MTKAGISHLRRRLGLTLTAALRLQILLVQLPILLFGLGLVFVLAPESTDTRAQRTSGFGVVGAEASRLSRAFMTARYHQRLRGQAQAGSGAGAGAGEKENPDPLVASLNEVSQTPCSCDCCQTSQVPGEDSVLKCTYGEANEMCPTKCVPSASDSVLSSGTGELDYSRYCHYKCRPAELRLGAMCARLDAAETLEKQDADGNGDSGGGEVTNIGGPGSWEEDTREFADKKVIETSEEEKTESKMVDAKMNYDIRKVVGNRKEAEAAQGVGEAQSALMRAKYARAQAEHIAQQHMEAQGLENDLVPSARVGGDAVLGGQGENAGGQEELEKATNDFLEAKGYSTKIAQEAGAKTVAEVNKIAQGGGTHLEGNEAKMKALDKPDFWPKVMATRAADAFLGQFGLANEGMQRFEGQARGKLAAGKGKQAAAKAIQEHMNYLKLQGDTLGIAAEQDKLDKTIADMKALEAGAKADYATAKGAHDALPKYQLAAQQAANRVVWEYKTAFS